MSREPTLSFYGAAETVTGAKFLVDSEGERFLIDCGQFQGLKELRLRNWQPFRFDPKQIHAVLLSHAHIDHSGLLPKLVKDGFRGRIYCTRATAALLPILLQDAARLMEEDARYANRKGFSKHHPALPLFDSGDVESALRLLKACDFHEPIEVSKHATLTFRRTGHILGAGSIDLELKGEQNHRVVYSGDIGRWDRPILHDPEFVPEADVLLVEATYGDRMHSTEDPNIELARILNEAAARGGAVIIPSFAVGRAQELIWRIRELEDASRIPKLPVFIDSPMALDVSNIFCDHPEEHDIDMQVLTNENRCPFCSKPYFLLRSAEASKALNKQEGAFVVIAGSGMATGGRVVHHLKRRVSDPRTTVVLAGFQAAGTRGRALQSGADTIRIHGLDVQVRARIEVIDGLSGHGDQGELMRWLGGFERAPRKVYVVHAEPHAAQTLANLITHQLGWPAAVARHEKTINL